jgi:hypothetical protein
MQDKQLVAIPDIKTVEQHPETLERLLIVGMLKSINFYRVLRGKVCPFDPKTQTYRPDFSVNLYNKLYVCIDSWWAKFDTVPLKRDLFFPPQHLENYLVDRSKKNLISYDEAIAAKNEMAEELERMEFTPELYQAPYSCDSFNYWLDSRATNFEINQLGRKFAIRPATSKDLFDAAARLKQTVSPIQNNAVNAGKPRLQTRQYFYADKARKGQGGLVPVDARFQFQRFSSATSNAIPRGKQLRSRL